MLEGYDLHHSLGRAPTFSGSGTLVCKGAHKMDIEVRRSIFLKALEQYDSSIRTVCLALIVIFFFHLLTLTPYVGWSRRPDATKMDLDRLLRSGDRLQTIR